MMLARPGQGVGEARLGASAIADGRGQEGPRLVEFEAKPGVGGLLAQGLGQPLPAGALLDPSRPQRDPGQDQRGVEDRVRVAAATGGAEGSGRRRVESTGLGGGEGSARRRVQETGLGRDVGEPVKEAR